MSRHMVVKLSGSGHREGTNFAWFRNGDIRFINNGSTSGSSSFQYLNHRSGKVIMSLLLMCSDAFLVPEPKWWDEKMLLGQCSWRRMKSSFLYFSSQISQPNLSACASAKWDVLSPCVLNSWLQKLQKYCFVECFCRMCSSNVDFVNVSKPQVPHSSRCPALPLCVNFELIILPRCLERESKHQ